MSEDRKQPINYPPIEREVDTPLSAFVVFCDEIRQENNGKLLLIGVYQEELIVPQLPALVQGVNIAVLVTGPEEGMISSLAIRVYHDEKLIVESGPDAIDRSLFAEPAFVRTDSIPRVFRIRAFLRTPPILIEKPSSLRVRVDTGDKVLRAGMLSLRAQTEKEGREDARQKSDI